MLCIFHFSSETAVESTETSRIVIHEILMYMDPDYAEEPKEIQQHRVDTLQFFVRKGAHFSIYALLAVLFLLPFSVISSTFLSPFCLSFLCSAVFSVSDEWHQSFVAGRSCELRDVLIDCAGALTALLLIAFLRILHRYIRRTRCP